MWLIRKVMRAARTESDLEGDRLQGALAEELQAAKRAAGGRPSLVAVPDSAPASVPLTPLPPSSVPPPTWPAPPASLPPPIPGGPLAGADLRDANPEHLPLISGLVLDRETQLRTQHPGAAGRSIDVLWVRSNTTHAVWLERRHATSPAAQSRDVICVARIDRGKVAERWSYG